MDLRKCLQIKAHTDVCYYAIRLIGFYKKRKFSVTVYRSLFFFNNCVSGGRFNKEILLFSKRNELNWTIHPQLQN